MRAALRGHVLSRAVAPDDDPITGGVRRSREHDHRRSTRYRQIWRDRRKAGIAGSPELGDGDNRDDERPHAGETQARGSGFHKTVARVLIHLTPLRSAAIVAAAGVLLTATGAPQYDRQALQTQLAKSRSQVISAYARIATETGAADALVARLDEDQTAVTLVDTSDAAAAERLWLRVGLDISLADQLTSSPSAPSSTALHGAQMRLFQSSADRTLQPVAVYVPQNANLDRPSALVLMLHGQGQTETDFLADPLLRQLADESGAILAVPWARGDRPADATTTADVYDALSSLVTNLKIDTRRVYLAGFSLGGFEVFMIAPHAANRWAGVLSVGGSLTNDDKDSFMRAMQGKPVFLVIGSDDPLVKAQYVKGASGYLSANGVDSHYYEERGGVHSLVSLLPSVQRAWNDMLAGVHFNTPEPDAPSPLPTPSLRY